MAILKTSLQNVRQQSVIKLINDAGAAQANITLLELKKSDETLDQANSEVSIQTVIFSASDSGLGPIVIARGPTPFTSANIMYLHGQGSMELDQGAGFHDQSNTSANITVLMPPYSMLYLVLGKSAGFIEPNQQIAPR
jgi:hypothetical protein